MALKPLLNQIFEPLLILTSIPVPLFPPSHSPSSSNAFDEIEFPRRGFPLAVGDWRDMLVYLYTSRVHDVKDERHAKMRLGMRKHAEGLRVREVARYMLGGHQIVVASVVEEGTKLVRSGVRLLRIERGAGVNDVGRDEEVAAGAAMQYGGADVEKTAPTQGPKEAAGSVSPIPPQNNTRIPSPSQHTLNSGSFHSSISIYSSNTHSVNGVNGSDGEGETLVDTVQSIVERDLRGWTLVESIRPQTLYLHHLALVVGEVHDYSVSVSASHSRSESHVPEESGSECGCVSFAEIVLGVVRDDVGVENDLSADGSISNEIPSGNAVLVDEVSPVARTKVKESQMEAVNDIRLRYLKAKMGVEQKLSTFSAV